MNFAAELAKYEAYVSYLGTIDVVDYMGVPYYPHKLGSFLKM